MSNLRSKLKRLFLLPFFAISIYIISSCASSVSISESKLSLYVDDTVTLTANSSDEDALVLWETSNKAVATVRQGRVKAIGKGECDISAYDDNGARASCHVSVDAMNVTISHSSKKVDLNYLNTFLLQAESDDGGDITWSSADENIATVNQNGLVVCHDTGNVKISAYRKGGRGNCDVTITDSGRAEDYYLMESGQKAAVMANPGKWYYWENGSSKVTKAVYQEGGFTSSIKALDSTGVFYRYQPGGDDGTGLKVGDKYRISFEVMLNVTGSLHGKKTVSVNANEWTNYSYSGTVSTEEPFYFSVRDMDIPSSGSIEVQVRNVKVGPDRAGDYYEITAGNNATVVASAGKWFYWTNGNDKVANAYYENKTVNFKISKLENEQGIYFRYQPGGSDNSGLKPGDEYTISMQITMNTLGKFTGKSTAEVTKENEFVQYSYEGTVDSASPFQITLKGVAVPEGKTLDVTIKNVSITKKAAPVGDQYEVEKGNNATCVANPGRWYYWTNGSDTVKAASYDKGVVSFSIDKLENEQGIYFRYQPGGDDGTGLEVGDEFTFTMNATMNITGSFTGPGTAEITTPEEFVEYSANGTVSASAPFQITLKGVEVPSSGTIDVTFKDIVIEKKEPTPPPADAYEILKGNNATVCADPGKWYYWTNGSDNVASASYLEGVSSFSIDKLENEQGIFFRYQPGGRDGSGLTVGDLYTIKLKITMNVLGTFTGKSTAEVTEANQFVDYEYDGEVKESEPFQIILKGVSVPENGTIDVTIKDVVVEEKEVVPTIFYNLEKGNNATCVANPGKWFYWPNGSDSVASATYTDGTIKASIDKLDNEQGMYFRYQPGGDDGSGLVVGDEYRISFDITLNVATTVYGKSSATVTTPGTFVPYTYQGTVGDSQPFNFTIKNVAIPASGTIDVTVKHIVIEKIVPVASDIPFGNESDAIADPGTWYLSKGEGDVVASTSLSGSALTVELSAQASASGTTLYYQPGANASNGLLLGDKYTMTYTVSVNSSGTIGGSSSFDVTADTQVEKTYSSVINGEHAFALNLKGLLMPESGNLIITISSMKFTSLPQGKMAVVQENPGVWFYNSAGSAVFNVIPRISDDLSTGSIGVELASLGTDHFYFRYQPGGADGTGCVAGDKFRLSFKIISSVSASFAYGTQGEKSVACTGGEEANVVYEGTVSTNIFYVKIDKSLSGPISVTLSAITVEKI